MGDGRDMSDTYHDSGSKSTGQHRSTASLGNWNDGLFDEIEMIPSVSREKCGSEHRITVDDVVGASTAYQPFLTERQGTSGRRSLTPQKSGVTGSAVRLMSCEKETQTEDVTSGEDGLVVQLDSAPRTRYTGILKKLEFPAHSGMSDMYASHKQEATPVGQTIPDILSGRTTTSKRLMFSSLPYKATTGRRVTFGGVSVDTPSPLYEGVEEDDRDSGTHMSLSSLNAGSTPFSGKSSSRMPGGCHASDESMITRDQLASALKKSLNFVDRQGPSFSFADPVVGSVPEFASEEKTTPDFSFQSSASKTRRRLTPPSCSPSLLALHGKAKRIATPQGGDSDEENTPVAHMMSTSSPHDQPKAQKEQGATMPRRSPRLLSKKGLKLSPTEQGIRDSLKEASRRRSSPQSDILKNTNM
jgi:hypothetical protein